MSRERIVIITEPPPAPPNATEVTEFKVVGVGTPLPSGIGSQYCLGVELETTGGLNDEQADSIRALLVETVEALHGIAQG